MKIITLKEKKFTKGDIIVTTSWRNGRYADISRGPSLKNIHAANIYDHDISIDEAAPIHLDFMRKTFGMCRDWDIEKMKETLSANNTNKFYLNTRGEVQAYNNHEVADEFDKFYFNNDIEISEVAKLKNKYIKEFNIDLSKYEGDEHTCFRVFDDITDWINNELSTSSDIS